MADDLCGLFADNLNDLIYTKHKEEGKSLSDIANEIGISSGALSKYQNNKAEPGIVAFAKIADYFGVSFDFLLGRSKTPIREHEDLAKQTGLSPHSVDVLTKMNGYNKGKFNKDLCAMHSGERAALDTLLSYDTGKEFLENLHSYLCPQVFLVKDPTELPHEEWMTNFIVAVPDEHSNSVSYKTVKNKYLNNLFFINLQQNLMELKKEAEQNGNDSKAGK